MGPLRDKKLMLEIKKKNALIEMKNSLHGFVSRLNTSRKRKTKLGLAKMAKYKDLELFSYSRHTKITIIYR